MSRSIIETHRVFFTWIFALFLFALLLFGDSIWRANYPVITGLMFFAGSILIGLAVIGRLWCALHISGYKTYHLVATGPYSMSRNPLYFFSFLGVLGLGLASGSLLITAIMTAFFALYYAPLIREEQKRLLEMHGESYREYLSRTPAFWPKLSLLNEPEEYTVQPRVYRRSMGEAVWFIIFLGLFQFIGVLHQQAVLPNLFSLV